MQRSILPFVCLIALGCACGPGTVGSLSVDPPQGLDASSGEPAVAGSEEPAIAPRDGRFPERVSVAGRELILNGEGLCEWGIFGIDLYRAALYVERRPESVAQALRADQTMVIHLDFERELTTAQLREAYSASIRANTGAEFDSYRQPLDELLATLQTVRKGDSYTFVAQPQKGLVVRRNNRSAATIADERFRELFVRLYLGDKPPTEALRRALLGGAR